MPEMPFETKNNPFVKDLADYCTHQLILLPRSSLDQMDRLTNPMVDCAKTVKHIDISAWKVVSPIHDRNSACQVKSSGPASTRGGGVNKGRNNY